MERQAYRLAEDALRRLGTLRDTVLVAGLTTFARELWWDDLAAICGDPTAPSVVAAGAAIVGGEARWAMAVLDATGPGDDEVLVRHLRYLASYLDQNWWPGPTGAVLGPDGMATVLEPPPETSSGDAGRDLLLAWVGQLLPTSLAARSIATGARRAGVEQGRQMVSRLTQTFIDRASAAERAGDLVAALHGTLVLADVLRRGGATDFLAGVLAVAEPIAAQIGAIGTAACLLFHADTLVAPLQSPETLGFDLEATSTAPEMPDASARAEAADAYAAARDLYRGTGARRGVAAVALRLAHLARIEGRYDEADALLAEATDDFTAAGDGAGRILALTHAAIVAFEAGAAGRTRPGPVEEILGWASTVGSKSFSVGCARIVHAYACSARDRGLVDAALASFDLATRLTRGLGVGHFTLAVLGDASEVYARLNSRGVTIAMGEEALVDLLEPHGGLDADGPLDEVVWMQAGMFAMSIQKEAIEERESAGLLRSATTLRHLLLRTPGGPRTPLAPGTDFLHEQQQAARRLEELGARRGGPLAGGGSWEDGRAAMVGMTVDALMQGVYTAEVQAEVGRALAAGRAGDDTEAERAFARALAQTDALGPAGISMSLSVLANSGQREELVRRTRAFLDASPDINPGFAAALWVNARCLDEAAAVLEAAGMADPPPSAPDAGWDEFELRARIALGQERVAVAGGYASQAVQRFETWFAAVPGDAFRVALADDVAVRRCYQTLALAAAAAGDPEAAFSALDRVRSLALAGLLAERRWAETAGASAPLLRAWREAQAKWSAAYDRRRAVWQSGSGTVDADALAATRTEVEAATEALDRATSVLDEAAPAVASRRPAPLAPASATEVKAAIPAGTLVVEYLLGEDQLLVWTLTSSTCQGRTVDVDSLAVSGTATRAHRAMTRGKETGLAEDLDRLAEWLLGPVQQELDGHSRIVVLPFGAQNLLPFHVLPFGGGRLGDVRSISQLPAASLIPRLAGRPAPRLDAGALVVGDPATNAARGLARLPGAAIEARVVARVLGTTPVVGGDATETAVRAALPSASIAHFATHGLLDEIAPNLSNLVLAGDDELTVAELLGLDLDLDLAVMSACDTGRGDVTSAGEVIGLARGFLAAGCRHTVVSLWPVDDVAACLTMATFAERLAAGAGVADALAAARAEIRAVRTGADRTARYLDLAGGHDLPPEGTRARDGRPPTGGGPPPEHPYWWAPFVHIGL